MQTLCRIDMSKDVAITDAFDPARGGVCALPQGRIGGLPARRPARTGMGPGAHPPHHIARPVRLTILLAMLACGSALRRDGFGRPALSQRRMVRISSVLPSANPQNENQPIPMFESLWSPSRIDHQSIIA